MKYFFFDIDGTLIAGGYGRGYVPESTTLTLQKLREKGYFTAISTGRGLALALPIMKQLGFENMVSDGGNSIVMNGELVGEIEPLDKEKVIALIDECNQKNIAWGLSLNDSITRYCPNDHFQEISQDAYMKTVILKGLDPRNCEKIFKVYIAGPPPVEYQLETIKQLPWCRYNPNYCFVEPCNKDKGIKRMMKILGGDLKDVVVFGDQMNDLSMFQDEWTSIAMGNAVEPLKEKANFVTKNVDDDGIFYACAHFGWI